MKIAVTYDNGNVFQHFGRTENFKVYEVEDGRVVSSEVMNSNGVGHEALAWLLKDRDIDVLICGGMGQGAQDALAEAGIEVCAGAEGNTDEAVAGSPQDCAGCAGCGGGAGFEPFYFFEGTNVGKKVKVHYRGTFDDGTQFDASYDRNMPLEFVCGVGDMIRGFDRAVAEMAVGDIIDVHLEPEEAYGMPNPNMVITVPKASIQGLDGIETGDKVMLQDELGRPFDALVTAQDEESITFDCNHEMAGKALNFTIEMLEIV